MEDTAKSTKINPCHTNHPPRILELFSLYALISSSFSEKISEAAEKMSSLARKNSQTIVNNSQVIPFKESQMSQVQENKQKMNDRKKQQHRPGWTPDSIIGSKRHQKETAPSTTPKSGPWPAKPGHLDAQHPYSILNRTQNPRATTTAPLAAPKDPSVAPSTSPSRTMTLGSQAKGNDT